MGWVSLHAVAILSALFAGAAVGIVVRQRVAQEFPADKGISGTMVTSLFREPLWVGGDSGRRRRVRVSSLCTGSRLLCWSSRC
jgi:hypothetical protein